MAGTADAVPVFLLLAVLDTWQGILVVGESRECEMDFDTTNSIRRQDILRFVKKKGLGGMFVEVFVKMQTRREEY